MQLEKVFLNIIKTHFQLQHDRLIQLKVFVLLLRNKFRFIVRTGQYSLKIKSVNLSKILIFIDFSTLTFFLNTKNKQMTENMLKKRFLLQSFLCQLK